MDHIWFVSSEIGKKTIKTRESILHEFQAFPNKRLCITKAISEYKMQLKSLNVLLRRSCPFVFFEAHAICTLHTSKNKTITIVSAAPNKLKISFYVPFCFPKSLFWSIFKIKLSIQSNICSFSVSRLPEPKWLPFYSQKFVFEGI